MKRVLLAGPLAVALWPGRAWAQDDMPPPPFESDFLLALLTEAASEWIELLLSSRIPMAVFGLLMVIDASLVGYYWAESTLAKRPYLLKVVVPRIAFYGGFTAVMAGWGTWAGALMNHFLEVGRVMSAMEAVNVAAVVDQGAAVTEAIRSPKIMLMLLGNPVFGGGFLPALIPLVIQFSFLAVAVKAILITAEIYMLFSMGPAFFCFAPLRATTGIAAGFVVWSIKVGVKGAVLYLLLSLGDALAPAIDQALTGWSVLNPAAQMDFWITCMVISVAYAALVGILPGSVSSLVDGWKPPFEEWLSYG